MLIKRDLDKMETVSVVIPAFNAESFITEAVKSCAAQTFRPLEVIVVNDGSTDNTVSVVEKLQRSSLAGTELRLIDLKINQGAANAVNTGFTNAKGKFVCWLSADDMYIDKKKVEKQLKRMKKTNAKWSYYKYFYMGPSLQTAKINRPSYLPFLSFLDPLFVRDAELRLALLLFRNPVNGSSIMISKDCIEKRGKFDPVTRNVDGDGDLWMRYSTLNAKLVEISGAPIFYREHSQQTSKKNLSMLEGCDLTRVRMLSFLEREGKLVRIIKKFAPFLPVVIETNYHIARPFVAEYIFKYILKNKKEFGRAVSKYAHISLRDVENQITKIGLNREEFLGKSEKFNQSQTFQEFEEIYKKKINW